MKQYAIHKKSLNAKYINPDSSVISFTKTPQNLSKPHVSEFHVPGTKPENNYEGTECSYEQLGSTAYVEMIQKPIESPGSKGT